MIRCRQVRGRQRLISSPPTSPPHGSLEQVAWLLLHQAVPFDWSAHHEVAGRWHLHGPPARAVPPAGPGLIQGRRTLDPSYRLRSLTAPCPPPASLLQALQLLGTAPWLTEHQVAAFLRVAAVTDLDDPIPVLRALEDLWLLEGSARCLVPTGSRIVELEQLARQVRGAGVLSTPRPLPARDTLWLRERRRVVAVDGHLVAIDDLRSRLARPVRRQLAAAGALDPDDLLEGCRRERPAFGSLTSTALMVWARHQPDIDVHVDCLALRHDGDRWLSKADTAVLGLFATGGAVGRPTILGALQHLGLPPPSAHQWLTHCGWLRHANARGHYLQVGARAAAQHSSISGTLTC